MTEPERLPEERLRPVARYVTEGPPTRTGDWRNVRPVFSTALPPCMQGCPASERVRDYIDLALHGRMEEAWRLIKEDNPIPAVTGRVCYHPCEELCNRRNFDEPVAIHLIERHIGDYGLEHGLQVTVAEPRKERVAVVGSGPAGLSAAYHLARKGYQVTVLEALAQLGGMLRTGIPAYRLPREILDGEIDNIRTLGVELVTDAPVGSQVSWDDLRDYQAIFLAAGCPLSRRLEIPGLELEGVTDGLSFLRAVNLGQRVEVGPRVLVLGGGNVAVDVGRVALRLGAQEVALACLESVETMPAYPEEKHQALAEGVRVLPGRHFLRLLGKNGGVRGVECVEIRSFQFDPSGGVTVEPVPGSEHLVEADSVVISIGQAADPSFLPEALLQQSAALHAGQPLRLASQWVVAGGDMVTGPSRVVDAIGAGKRASMALDALLRGQGLPTEEPAAEAGYEALNVAYFRREARQREAVLSPGERTRGFAEVVGGLKAEEVLAEARRCFYCGDCNLCGNCWLFCPEMSIELVTNGHGTGGSIREGRFEIDYHTCKGCGICVRECPRSALLLEEEVK